MDWLLTVPLLLTELVLVLALAKKLQSSLLWRLIPASALMIALGYPGEISSGDVVSSELESSNSLQLFHAGTRLSGDGSCQYSGGRVLPVCAHAEIFDAAFEQASPCPLYTIDPTHAINNVKHGLP